ncbi:MAG: VOC family protein [Rhizobiaceae bacterium]|nr:VOC family protein [Rhizobiaceae bacterium]
MKIQHMAFAVRDAEQALEKYRALLSAGDDAEIVDYAKSKTRVALFRVGGIEYQLCQSLEPGGRFDAWLKERGSEGLHHICYAVPSIEDALDAAIAKGATLKTCVACGVAGKHPHPEGFVAFLNEDVGGLEVEFMQLYTDAELEEYASVKGI